MASSNLDVSCTVKQCSYCRTHLRGKLNCLRTRLDKRVNKSILIYQKDKIIVVNLDSVALIELENNVVKILTFDNEIFYAREKYSGFSV